jgi:perosamine synthetase
LGATPIFVDILSDSWCIDPSKVESAITSRTKAIVAVHLYGNLCRMDELLTIGQKYGIPVIEDAAEAIGSTYKGKNAGSIGKFGVFSFHGSKTLTAGEGGMFVTNDKQLYEHVLTLSNHGRVQDQSKQFWAEIIGFKYKMSNIQAAIGLGQLQRIHELVFRKREILDWYKNYFQAYEKISINPTDDGCINGAWMPTLVFQPELGITREILQNAFINENIDARVFFWPLSSLPMFKSVPTNLNAWDIPNRAINLPSYHDMTEDDLQKIGNLVLNLIK